MGINFPSSPADGQIFNASPGVSFVARSGRWAPAPLKAALPRNYLINPAMQVSQEWGDAASPAAVSGSYYLADQWIAQWNFNTGVFAVSRGRSSPAGGDYATLSCSTVGTLAAASQMQFGQFMEGQRVADFQFGTVKAQQAIFNFNLIANFTGTYAVNIRNTDNTRSYLAPLVIANANVWNNYTFVIPGDTTGTWANDNTRGMSIGFGFAGGSTYTGVAGWQNGLMMVLPGQNSIMGNVGSVLIGDLGFYRDPYLTGVAPSFVVPSFADEIRRSQRYFYRAFGLWGVTTGATTVGRAGLRHPVPMRTTPVGSIKGTPKCYDMGVTPIVTALATVCNSYAAEFDITCAAGGFTAGRAATMYYQSENDYIAMSARV
jgi:hypothetical protein